MNESRLTFLILLFITAEGDHDFLGPVRFTRSDKVVVTLSGNWRLGLTCWRIRRNKSNCFLSPQRGSLWSSAVNPDLALISFGLWWAKEYVRSSSRWILLFGSPHPSQDSPRSLSPGCELLWVAFQTHLPEPETVHTETHEMDLT